MHFYSVLGYILGIGDRRIHKEHSAIMLVFSLNFFLISWVILFYN